MRTAHVQVIAQSSLVTGTRSLTRAIAALQLQARRHFAPAWGIDAELELTPRHRIDPRAWVLAIVDDATSAEDDGLHELSPHGQPMGKVFVKAAMADAGEWTSTASHELLELLADPGMAFTAAANVEGHPRMYAFEVCDAVQGNQDRYLVGDVHVSDFVYPSWFETFHKPRSVPFDHLGRCRKPLELRPGGYAMIAHVDAVTGWHDLSPRRNDRTYKHGSRRARRAKPKSEWRKSRRVTASAR